MANLDSSTVNEDILYYDVVRINDGKIPVKAAYRTTMSMPLVDKAKDFRGSIVRFSLPGTSIPKLIWKSTFQICLRLYGSYSAIRTVSLVSDVADQEAKNNPDFKNFVYEYQTIADSINNTLRLLYADLTALAGALPATYPPWITYDSNSKTFIFYAQPAFYADQSKGGQMEMLFNCDLIKLFPNFLMQYRYSWNNTAAPTLDCWTALRFNQVGNVEATNVRVPYLIDNTTPVVATTWKNPQSYVSLADILDIKGIIITSSTLTARPEVLPGVGTTAAALNSSLNIISDYAVLSGDGTDLFTGISYLPTAQYRFFDLLGEQEIREIDFEVFWYTSSFDIRPFYINPGETYTIKLLLQKKYPHTSIAITEALSNAMKEQKAPAIGGGDPNTVLGGGTGWYATTISRMPLPNHWNYNNAVQANTAVATSNQNQNINNGSPFS